MSNLVFPPTTPTPVALAWGNKRRPEFSTTVNTASSGRDTRVSKWAFPKWHWLLTYGSLGEAGHEFGDQLRAVEGFFLTHHGRGESFLFQDPEDYVITDQVIGVGNGSTRAFQIVRNYGGFVEPIYDIKSGTLSVKKAGVVQGSGWSQTSGLVTFTAAPANGEEIKASCQFYFRVTFEEDEAEFENFTYRLHALREVGLVLDKR